MRNGPRIGPTGPDSGQIIATAFIAAVMLAVFWGMIKFIWWVLT